jgi:molecular chaperone DnaK
VSVYYGIDFGTTNTALVALDERTGVLRNIGDEEDNNPMPSIVAVRTFDDRVAVGRKVRVDADVFRDDQRHLVFRSVKSVLDSDEVHETDTRAWNSEEISAELFKALAERVNDARLPPLTEAAVAIPVGMSAAKRQILRRAASRAGIRVASFISEPTAAFIAHAKEFDRHRTVIVFDWGGGTLDISVLRQVQGRISELRTAGLAKAGDEIDELLARWMHERIAEERNLNLPFDSVALGDRERLISQCESAKIAVQEDGVFEKEIYLSVYAGEHLVQQRISRQEFENLVFPLVDEAINLLFRCVHDAAIPFEEIGKVVLVGGTSKLSIFHNELRRRWEYPNLMFPDGAEWDIARGAAYLARRPGAYRTAHRIGLELCDGKFYSAIQAGIAVNEASKQIGLGLVEEARTATLLFATQKNTATHERIGELHVPCLGFRDETISLACGITEDLVFEAHADSSHIQKNGFRERFTFEELRWEYDLGL